MPPVNRNDPKRARGSDSDYSLMEFMQEFPNDTTCLDWLWRRSFSPDSKTAECPKCERPRSFHRVKSRPSYSCDSCGHHLHPTAGTIFHKSSTSLHLWFYAIFMMSQTRCGVSAKQLERELGVTYKTAWRMMNLIRNQLMTQDDDTPLSGEVEADETWVGGKLRNSDRSRARKSGGATMGQYVKKRPLVFGMVERGGRVVALTMPERRYGYALRSKISERVEPGSTVYTDDYRGYLGIDRLYRHETIKHTERVYVDGSVHTQAIEGFFALVKNGIRGVYHSVSPKWLPSYLNEYAFRYNHRDDDTPQFRTLLVRAAFVR